MRGGGGISWNYWYRYKSFGTEIIYYNSKKQTKFGWAFILTTVCNERNSDLIPFHNYINKLVASDFFDKRTDPETFILIFAQLRNAKF